MKTISQVVAERFVQHCQGVATLVHHEVTYKLKVSIVEEDYISVHVATISLETTDEQVRTFFSKYGDVVRVVKLNHGAHLDFPIYSGRRLVVFKKIYTNIPQHLEMGGTKLRASYDLQVKVCPLCAGNHIRHRCALYNDDINARQPLHSSSSPTNFGPVVLPVTVPNRKRFLSAELEANNATSARDPSQ